MEEPTQAEKQKKQRKKRRGEEIPTDHQCTEVHKKEYDSLLQGQK